MFENKSYTNNYFKIYFWKFISYFASFASLAFVTPRITNSPALYGIFAFCMSLNIFFQYADLGFINAAQKYASEYFGKKDLYNEIRVVGFSCFMFLLFIIPVNLGILWIAFNPEIVIKGISSSPEEMRLASNLLLTLFFFAPVLIIQRVVQIIFSIRLEDYFPQRISIVASVLRVISVFYFFGDGRYMLWEYFLFYNSLSLVSLLISIIIAKRRYNYNFFLLLRSFRYTKEMYAKTAALAFNSLVLAFSWILFYELDLVYIGFFLGKEAVAHYSIGFTILMFFRDAFGTFYYPFLVRFNHYVGTGNFGAIKELYHTLLKIGAPLVVLPITTMITLAFPVITSWVGVKYESSVIVVQLLIASSLLGFITYPVGALLNARVELRVLYINALILPAVFFTGVFTTQHLLGINAYAVFKVVAIYLNVILFLLYTLRYLQMPLQVFIKKYIKTLVLPVSFIILLGILVNRYVSFEKSLASLIKIGALFIIIVFGGLAIYYLIDPFSRLFVRRIYSDLVTKKELSK